MVNPHICNKIYDIPPILKVPPHMIVDNSQTRYGDPIDLMIPSCNAGK